MAFPPLGLSLSGRLARQGTPVIPSAQDFFCRDFFSKPCPLSLGVDSIQLSDGQHFAGAKTAALVSLANPCESSLEQD
jgi:hypothetical protein